MPPPIVLAAPPAASPASRLASKDYAATRKRGSATSSYAGSSAKKARAEQIATQTEASVLEEIQERALWRRIAADTPASGRFCNERKDKYDEECEVDPRKVYKAREIAAKFAEQKAELLRQKLLGAQAWGGTENDVAELATDTERSEEEREKALCNMYECLKLDAQKEEIEICARFSISTRFEQCTDNSNNRDTVEGDARLEAIYDTFHSLGYTLSEFQNLFEEQFVRACLPLIYGADWPLVCERVLKKYGIDRIRPEVLVQTPRRFGKTISIAIFVASMLLNMPGIRICIFSTGQRASSALMAEITKLINRVEGGGQRIIKQTQEQLFISSKPRDAGVGLNSEKSRQMQANDGEMSRLYSFPAGTAGWCNHSKGENTANLSLSKRVRVHAFVCCRMREWYGVAGDSENGHEMKPHTHRCMLPRRVLVSLAHSSCLRLPPP